ncbi:MAG: histidinol-phosphate aminotransferase family protein [Phycisphaerales bacterium]|nr:histidinol-phosphate aminotransferase family protein [Phycisphaerales bacterium]
MGFVPKRPNRLRVVEADAAMREQIYRNRHEVYAAELGQHAVNLEARLTDALDDYNVYLAACDGDKLVGYISITPPGNHKYSIEKYVDRSDIPVTFDDGLYELRLLTVTASRRSRVVAAMLMYAVFRWISDRGGRQIVAMGRREVLPMYQRVGLRTQGVTIQSGSVTFELLTADIESFQRAARDMSHLVGRVRETSEWELDVPFTRPAPCYHGGAFFEQIGEEFDDLNRRHDIINADVLDAWFPPAPRVMDAVTEHLPWIARTSPPTRCAGLARTIADVRGLPTESIALGAGSSDLIFRVLPRWLTARSRVLLLDPTYGEYAHVLEHVIGCDIARHTLSPEDGFAVDIDRLRRDLRGCDLAIIVNPNSPTGRYLPGEMLRDVIETALPGTRFWLDETYMEYVDAGASLEAFAANSKNVFVCKSMSKVYALSGMRAAYLCGEAEAIADIQGVTPPWVIGLPSQIAAVEALRATSYYAQRYLETHTLRAALCVELRALGLRVFDSVANFVLCLLDGLDWSPPALVEACAARGLFIRDASGMSAERRVEAIRIAVKDADTNKRIVAILRDVMSDPGSRSADIEAVRMRTPQSKVAVRPR